jgi:hypothetical protein
LERDSGRWRETLSARRQRQDGIQRPHGVGENRQPRNQKDVVGYGHQRPTLLVGIDQAQEALIRLPGDGPLVTAAPQRRSRLDPQQHGRDDAV